MIKIGLIVNPIAGMGGSVGLKGTDGGIYKKALELGAKPVTPDRTKKFLFNIAVQNKIMILVPSGDMGENFVKNFDIPFKILGSVSDKTSSVDTKRFAKKMLSEDVDLLVFVGGDGTARDIFDAIGLEIPVIGVPSGVKIFSPVFAFSSEAAAEILNDFVMKMSLHKNLELIEKEVLDIDEQAFRENKLASQIYGYLKVPNITKYLQKGKEASNEEKSSIDNKKEIAKFLINNMQNDTLYLLGPGTTLKTLTEELHISKTLLGVDAIFNGELIGIDLNENKILNLLNQYNKAKIIVTPIGGNGFIFGRGSKQFTPKILQQVGRENLIIIGTYNKIKKLECLRVDTGDLKIDKLLSGQMKVITGEKEEMIMQVKS